MRKTIIYTLLSFFLIAPMCSHLSGPARHGCLDATGADGVTCCNCHGGATAADGGIFITENSQNAATLGYLYGQSHLMMVELLSTSSYPISGISMTVVDSNGYGVGSFLPGNTTNAVNLPITTCTTRNRSYVEQLTGITPFVTGGSNYRSFIGASWVPGFGYYGPVHFFASGVIANGNNAVTGDACFSTSLTLYPAHPLEVPPGSTAITTDSGRKASILYDDPVRLLYIADEASLVKTYIHDLTGACVASGAHETIRGLNTIELPKSLSGGLYVLSIKDWDGSATVLKLIIK